MSFRRETSPEATPKLNPELNPELNPDSAAERCLMATTARLLAASADSAGALGLLCSAVAAATLLLLAPIGLAALALAAVLVLAPLERVLALRLQFDAGLFADLAAAHAAPKLALGLVDQALQALRLRQPAAAFRPLPERVLGAQRLIFWHGCTVAAQFAGLLLAILLVISASPEEARLGARWGAR